MKRELNRTQYKLESSINQLAVLRWHEGATRGFSGRLRMTTNIRFEVPADVIAADHKDYADTPDVYEVTIDDAIPGGCMINGIFVRAGATRLVQNVSARRLVRMLLQGQARQQDVGT